MDGIKLKIYSEDSNIGGTSTQKSNPIEDESSSLKFPYLNAPFFSPNSKPQIIKALTKRERASWQQKVVLEKVFDENQVISSD